MDDDVHARVLRRGFEEVRLTAGQLAQSFGVSRDAMEGYLADPLSLPFPLQLQLAALVGATNLGRPETLQLMQMIQREGGRAIREYAVQFYATLRGLPLDVAAAALRAHYANPPMGHPNPEWCTSLEELAARKGLTVAVYVAQFTGP